MDAQTLQPAQIRERYETRSKLTLTQRRYLFAAILIAPVVLLRLFTTLYPFIQTAYLSMQSYNPAFPPQRFIGLGNFERLFRDIVVRESISFTLMFAFISTFFELLIGLAIAHLLNANFRLRGLARTINLIPWAIPTVVIAIAFRWMLDSQFGLIPDLLSRFGIEHRWLLDPYNARVSVLMVNIWKNAPFAAMLLLAGMQGIPHDLYEAAKVDGANWLHQLRFITVPLLLPVIVSVGMFLVIWQMAAFDLPFVLTGGGPGFATTVFAQKIFLEVTSLNYGYASALGMMMVFAVILIGGVGLWLFRRVEVSH